MESSKKWKMKDGILKPGRENVGAEVKIKSEWVWEWQSEAEALLGIQGRAEVWMASQAAAFSCFRSTAPIKLYSFNHQLNCFDQSY